MKEYIGMVVEIWSYKINANSEEEVRQLVQEDPGSYKLELHEVEVTDVEERYPGHEPRYPQEAQ